MDKAKEKYGKECFNVVNEPIQLHHDPDLPYIYFLAIDPLHTVKLGRLKHEYVSTYQVLLCYISGAVNDVLRRLALVYPGVMREFLGELSLKYSRSGMPGKMALNGPQIDKVWKNLDLLHEKLVKQGAGVIGEGSVDYLQKLQALYFMCARYLFCLPVNQ